MADVEEAGDDDVIRKVIGDLSAAGIARTDADLKEQLARLLPVARDEINREAKG